MTACIPPDTLARFRNGAITSVAELRSLEAHLEECASCRDALLATIQGAAETLPAKLLPSVREFPCLEEEVLIAYVEETLEATEREIVEEHLALCSRCTEDVASLRAFREEMNDFDWNTLGKESAWERFKKKAGTAFGLHGSMEQATDSLQAGWRRIPLTLRILGAGVLGFLIGHFGGSRALLLQPIGDIFFKLLNALAIPLLFMAIVHVILKADTGGFMARRLIRLLLTNTLVAIGLGLLVVNLLHPGQGVHLTPPPANDPRVATLKNVPDNILEPLSSNNILFVLLFAVGVGMALRTVRQEQQQEGKTAYQAVEDGIETVLRGLGIMLRWVIALVPLTVLAVVAALVGKGDFGLVRYLLGFVGTVLIALALHATYYLIRLRTETDIAPFHFLKSVKSAFLTAFTTGSSVATMPVTYSCMRDKLGISRSSSHLGIFVAGYVNHDGTALYLAMAPLFIAQAVGMEISLPTQFTIACMSVVASFGIPGIPNASMITLAVVFHYLGLPPEYILLLFVVDWFLDRCRTTINVMGHSVVTCLLEGKETQ